MMRDEFDLLFDEPKPATTKSRIDWFAILLIAVALIASGFVVYRSYNFRQGSDDSAIVDEYGKGSMIVFVLELQNKTIDQDLILRGMSDFVVEKKLVGFRALDRNLPESDPFKQFAESKNVVIPAMFLVSDRKIRKVSKFPNDRKELEAFAK